MRPRRYGGPVAASRSHRRTWLGALILLACTPLTLASDSSDTSRAWLAQVDALLTDSERQAFSTLDRNYQREAFIARFWHQRDPLPETPRNEFLDTWEQRLEVATEMFEDLGDTRARTMLLIGLPALMLPDLCPELLRPVEAWYYPDSEAFPKGFFLVFAPSTSAPLTLEIWSPERGPRSLLRQDLATGDTAESVRFSQRCTRGRDTDKALALAVSWEDLRDQRDMLPPEPDPWVEEFLDRTIAIDREASAMTAAMQVAYPGSLEEKTVVQVELTLPSEVATPTTGNEAVFALRIDGEVLRGETLFDQFRYDFELPVAGITEGEIPLAFQRNLLPGDYALVLRLEDRASGHVFNSDGRLHVPHPAELAPAPDSRLAEANAVLGTGDHMVKIQPLPDQLLTGRVRVEAQVLGEEVAKVGFVLNERPVMSKTRPPFSLEIDLGQAPRLHWLEAIASDSAGRELARDRVPINAGPHRFSVRLIEPRQGQRYIGSLRAAAEVHLPAGEELERVDFYLNESRLASLYQPPFVQPLLLPQNQRITYVRAVAYLDDGNATEDLVFVNAPREMAHLTINMIELFTTVSDKKGQPVEGLALEDFTVREEGKEQQLRRFERVRDLPVHASVILDASTSMREELDQALDAAVQFFVAVIQPKDRAAVFVFNDEPELKVPFTNRIETLTAALAGIDSEGETALYDTLVYALHYFAGIRGKRALILLSDGEDSKSRYRFAEALEFAQRSGVAIYTIGLGLDRRQLEARNILQRLARETGGRYFSIVTVRELEGIYSIIEQELRSQYLLAYQSSHESGGDFRRVEVEVARDGLKAKTIPGYYP